MKKTVLITGASKGIGRSMAREFAQEGYNVVINYCNSKNEAEKLEKELTDKGYSVKAIKADVSNYSEVLKMLEKTNNIFGTIDILINNAGIAQQKLFTDITDEDFDNMVNINLKGVFNCTKAVLRDMINKKYGKIINISSMWGVVGASCEVHYSAVKAGVIGMTKALAKEVGPSGINVNCIAPGVINTQMNSNLDEYTINSLKEETPLGIIGEGEDIASLALFLASDKSKFITGQIITADGGLTI